MDLKQYKPYITHDLLYKFDDNGNLCNVYNTVKDAAKDAKSNMRLILNAIAGKSKSKGFYYSYNEDFKIDSHVYDKVTNVYLYDLNGTFFKAFSSPKECANYFNDEKTSRLYAALRTGGLYKGYQVSKEKVGFMKSIEKSNAPKKVAQYDLNNNLIKV